MEYQPLDASKNSIRLLWIEPLLPGNAESDPTIHCSMSNVSLDEYTDKSAELVKSGGLQSLTRESDPLPKPGNCVIDDFDGIAAAKKIKISDALPGRWKWGDFVALSYTWGSSDSTRDVVVDGHRVRVGENLEDFLQHMRTAPDSAGIGIWVDALCINQRDIIERNTEVKRMGTIYRMAFSVISWVGKEADQSEKALELIEVIFNSSLGSQEDCMAFLDSLRTVKKYFEGGYWNALLKFVNRPYWKRLWVVQEVALSKTGLSITCGNHSLNWAQVAIACHVLCADLQCVLDCISSECKELGIPNEKGPQLINGINRIAQLSICQGFIATNQARRQSLRALFTIIRGSDQQDARDKVYGVMSLIEPSVSRNIHPDYNLPLLNVYTDFVKACITSTGSLDIICEGWSKLLSTEDFPSWVPDLRVKYGELCGLSAQVLFHSNADSTADVTFVQNDKHLRARGFRVDTVDGLGCFEDVLITDDEEDIWKALPTIQPTHFSGHNPYVDEDGLRNALWHTFVANRDVNMVTAPETYECLVNIPWDKPLALSSLDEHMYFTSFDDFIQNMSSFQIGSRPLGECLNRGETEYELPPEDTILDAVRRAIIVMTLRRFMVTEKGHIGLVTKLAMKGDAVCILLGCSTPVILRPCSDGSFRLVGDCYIHGMMEGEAMKGLENGDYSEEYFTIT